MYGGPVRAKLRAAERMGSVEFLLNGRRVATDRKRPFLRKLPYRKLQARFARCLDGAR